MDDKSVRFADTVSVRMFEEWVILNAANGMSVHAETFKGVARRRVVESRIMITISTFILRFRTSQSMLQNLAVKG